MSEETGEVTAEQMLAAAAEFDAQLEAGSSGLHFETEDGLPDEQPEAETEPEEEQVEEPEEEPEGSEEPGPDNTDKQVSSLTEGEPTEPEKQEKSKWAKNESRKKNAWRDINARKEELASREQVLAQQTAELQALRDKAQEGQEYRDERGYTASDYERAAEELKEDGDPDLAKRALEKADKVRGVGKQRALESEQKKAQAAWDNKRSELMEKVPELKNNDSELTKLSNDILRTYPILTYNPQGLDYAVEIAKLKMNVDSGEAAKAEVKKLSKKLKNYEKKMSVTGGFTADKPEGEKTFDDMNADQQEVFLRKAAAMADEAM